MNDSDLKQRCNLLKAYLNGDANLREFDRQLAIKTLDDLYKKGSDLEQALIDIEKMLRTITKIQSSKYMYGRVFGRALFRRIYCEFEGGIKRYLTNTNKRKGLRR